MKTPLKMAAAASLFAVALAATLTAGQHAATAGETAAEKQAIVTRLDGKATAVTYWVRGNGGLEVVTTIDAAANSEAAAAAPAIVRVSAVLQPGQQQVISVPGDAGRAGAALRISRVDDRIAVEKVSALSY